MSRLAALVLLAFATAARAADPAAEVVSVEGKGEFRQAQENGWHSVSIKQTLFPTNFVRTLDQSKMAIVSAARTQVRLAPNSTMQIKEVSDGPEKKTILDLNRGRSWTQSKTTP